MASARLDAQACCIDRLLPMFEKANARTVRFDRERSYRRSARVAALSLFPPVALLAKVFDEERHDLSCRSRANRDPRRRTACTSRALTWLSGMRRSALPPPPVRWCHLLHAAHTRVS